MASSAIPSSTTGEGVRSTALTSLVPSLPPASQRSSRLIQLPAELRLEVLRYLLVTDVPIDRRLEYQNPGFEPTRKKVPKRARDAQGRFVVGGPTHKQLIRGYHITPSVLRACQHIFQEALPILYYENTLQVKVFTYKPGLPVHIPQFALDMDGNFSKHSVRAGVVMFDRESIMDLPPCFDWYHNESLANLASRFRNFLVVVSSGGEIREPAQIRYMLKAIAPIFLESNVKADVYRSDIHPSQGPTARHIQLIKFLSLLRCSSFHLTKDFGITTIDVQNVVTSGTPVLDLEKFLPSSSKMLNEVIDETSHHTDTIKKTFGLLVKLTEAITDFDVKAFLQARLKFLQNWQNLVKRQEHYLRTLPSDYKGYLGGHRELHRVLNIRLWKFNVIESIELGLEVKEDGEEINAELRELARQYNFVPEIGAQGEG